MDIRLFLIVLLMLIITAGCETNNSLATSASISTNKNTASLPISPEVTGGDAGDSYIFGIVEQANNGKAYVSDNQLVYTPDHHYSGTDQFVYQVTAGDKMGVGTATVSVQDLSDRPLASQTLINSRSGITATPVTPYVEDPDYSETYNFSVTAGPNNGIAQIINNRLVYTPNIVSGSDRFEYQVTDSQGYSITGTAKVRIYENTNTGTSGLNRCRYLSSVNPDGTFAIRTNAGHCAIYGEHVSRLVPGGGGSIVLQYVIHRPSNGAETKAVIVLIAGGALRLNPQGEDVDTGFIGGTGGNFLVRTAQLLADGGYRVIVMNRPSNIPNNNSATDQYRISVDHAVDILELVKLSNSDNLPLIIAGTSRGALSAVATSPIATAIHISSPVTSGNGASLYVGKAGVDNLQVGRVQVPVRVTWHQGDTCPFTTPANAQSLYNTLNTNLGNMASSTSYQGGVEVTVDNGTVAPNDCGAFDFHGFMGIETTVINGELNFFQGVIDGLTDTPPIAAGGTIYVKAGSNKNIDLARFTHGIGLSYSLPYTTTSRGATVSLNENLITYSPGGLVNGYDYFVYTCKDINGNLRSAVIRIEII